MVMGLKGVGEACFDTHHDGFRVEVDSFELQAIEVEEPAAEVSQPVIAELLFDSNCCIGVERGAG